MTKSSYFFYGSALPQPVLSGNKLQQFALYSPIPGRFCLVYHDQKILRTVVKLFSSRYNLRLCRLDSANNFENNLIDNEVCFHWAPESNKGMGFTRFLSPDDYIYDVEQLKWHEDLLENELLYQDREYFWLAVNWIEFLDHACFDPYYKTWIEEDLRSYADLPIDMHPLLELKNKIFSIIYHDFDFDSAQKAIDETLKEIRYRDFKELNLRFNNWL